MQLDVACRLIQHSTHPTKSVWIDLGCGDGLFTRALSTMLAEESSIIAIDKSEKALANVFIEPGIHLKKLVLDFEEEEIPFKNLSGILMANSFHFVKNKTIFLQKCIACLNDDGYFLIVEYDTDTANPWVPYPVSLSSLKNLFSTCNYDVEKLHEIRSRYNGLMYSAVASKK